MVKIKYLNRTGFDPEIGACILSSINLGYASKEDIPKICNFLVNFLDELIDYEDFKIPEVEYAAKNRRALGIGISNLFGFLAKSKVFYNSQNGKDLTQEYMELIYYNLLKSSLELAKIKGKCNFFDDTKYSEGWLNFDEYSIKLKLDLPWNELREDIKKYGLRNSTFLAHAPTANSSNLNNCTPGVEPPRELITTQSDKNSTVKKVVPYFKTHKNYYTQSWGIDFNNSDYFKLLGIIQAFSDQAISTNQYSNALKNGGKIDLFDILKEIIIANKSGLKTMYYQNFLSTDNEDGISEEPKGCESGGCSV